MTGDARDLKADVIADAGDAKARAHLGIEAAVLGAIFYAVWLTQIDVDIFGRIKFGLDYMAARSPSVPDRYSYLTAGCHWLDHEWLSETLFAWMFQNAGWVGLVAFKGLVGLAGIAILWWVLKRTNPTLDVVGRALVLLPATFLIVPGLHVVRALAFTFVALGLVLLLIVEFKKGNRKAAFFIPPIFALWVNLHGAYFSGIVTVFFWAFLETGHHVLKVRNKSAGVSAPAFMNVCGTVWIVAIASLLASFFNPHGVDVLMHVMQFSFAPRVRGWEWEPIRIASPEGLVYLAFAACAFASIILTRRKRDLPLIGVWCIFAVAPLIGLRHMGLFAVATVILCADYLADLWDRRAKKIERPIGKGEANIVAAIGIAMCLVMVGVSLVNSSKLTIIKTLKVPYASMRLLKRIHAKGNMAVDVNWGMFSIYHVGPDVRVSDDTRDEQVYSYVAMLANRCFRDGIGSWSAILDTKNAPADFVLVDQGTAAYNLMSLKPGWTKVLDEEECSGLFVRTGSEWQKAIAAYEAEDPGFAKLKESPDRYFD